MISRGLREHTLEIAHDAMEVRGQDGNDDDAVERLTDIILASAFSPSGSSALSFSALWDIRPSSIW